MFRMQMRVQRYLCF